MLEGVACTEKIWARFAFGMVCGDILMVGVSSGHVEHKHDKPWNTNVAKKKIGASVVSMLTIIVIMAQGAIWMTTER